MEIQYQGFVATILFAGDVGIFYGEVLNAKEWLTFQAVDLNEAKALFIEMIERYLYRQGAILSESYMAAET